MVFFRWLDDVSRNQWQSRFWYWLVFNTFYLFTYLFFLRRHLKLPHFYGGIVLESTYRICLNNFWCNINWGANPARICTAYNTVYNVETSYYRYAVQQLFMTKWSTRQLQSLWIGSLYGYVMVFASLISTSWTYTISLSSILFILKFSKRHFWHLSKLILKLFFSLQTTCYNCMSLSCHVCVSEWTHTL